jgi:excisionase family DNA binding protein
VSRPRRWVLPAPSVHGTPAQAAAALAPQVGARVGPRAASAAATADKPRNPADSSVTGARRRPGLDQPPESERRSSTRRSGSAPAAVGGFNRLITAEELAAYLGVPKKTVYGCWRQWGLTACKVGRHLRFRERHVEEWLKSREA